MCVGKLIGARIAGVSELVGADCKQMLQSLGENAVLID